MQRGVRNAHRKEKVSFEIRFEGSVRVEMRRKEIPKSMSKKRDRRTVLKRRRKRKLIEAEQS